MDSRFNNNFLIEWILYNVYEDFKIGAFGGKWVKLIAVMLTSTPVWVPAAAIPLQLPASAPEKATEFSPSNPVTHMEDSEFLAPGFSLKSGAWTSEYIFSLSAFKINKSIFL